jgi:diguanylate cyclase
MARYGDDEFALLFAMMTLKQAEKRMPEVVARIAETEISFEASNGPSSLRLTVSCGMAEWAPGDTAERLLRRADEALYAAKQQGRGRSVAKRPFFWR